jgi:signal transduction histidine kinase
VGALLYFELGVVYFLLLVSAWAVVGVPVQQFVQRNVNRLMYGRRDEPMAVLQSLGERLELGSPETVLHAIVETVATTLKLPRVEIRTEGGLSLAAVGASDLDPMSLPIVHQGEQVAELVVSPRARDEALQEQDHAVLRLIARQAAPTVSAVQLNQALRRSRQEILLGREEERRRIRRDLHDGLGPALAAIAMQADTARAVVDDDPTLTRELLNAITGQAEDVVQEVRRLVYELRPPALDELGLFGAVERLAAQQSSGSLHVTVGGERSLPALDAAVEVGAFRIVSEALTNVARHSGANLCTVEFTPQARHLGVVIEDNGRGLPDSFTPGIGLRSMQERAAEVGGSATIERRAPHGTRVTVSLPLRSEGQPHA